MNTTTNDKKMQSETTSKVKLSRADIRRQKKAAAKSLKSEKKNNAKKQALSKRNEAILQKADEILKNLKAQTWHTLETNGKFSKNDKGADNFCWFFASWQRKSIHIFRVCFRYVCCKQSRCSLIKSTTSCSHRPLSYLVFKVRRYWAVCGSHRIPACFSRFCKTILFPLSIAPLPQKYPFALYSG